MAVKVVKKKPDASVVKRVVCSKCGATLEYTTRDVTYHTHYDYGGGSDVYGYVACPACGENVHVSTR